ncbi:MAG: serine/threonine-protein kinase [Microbacterium sp.]
MSRRPSPPPQLPGFTFLEPLGTGGFADVFLYEQQMPRRRVAVKVMLADRLSTQAAQEFAEEANVMAMLSAHPAIVTIYQSGVAGDGRPYLVMEYCPRPNLHVRSRKEPFLVAEALRVGIQVAGAVETAHRAGVLHRDIKPANILVTEYNRPALTDFGIASNSGDAAAAAGMSIPWSPPESFAEPPLSGPRTDVWALGATIYTLLAGRSPFERPGERNSGADLIERIERAALPPLGRPDSPESLQRVLATAMAKNPDDRYPSAVAFARALQKVQIELSHSVTPIDIVDEHPSGEEVDDGDGLTRVREIVSIDPDAVGFTRPSATTQRKGPVDAPIDVPRFDAPPRVAAGVPNPGVPTAVVPSVEAPTAVVPSVPVAQSVAALDDGVTIARTPQQVLPYAVGTPAAGAGAQASSPRRPASEPQKPRSLRGLWIGLSALAVVLVVVAIVGLNLVVAGLRPESTSSPEPGPATDPLVVIVPKVADLTGTRAGDQVSFTWTNPDPAEGDSYIWNVVDVTGEAELQQTTETTVAFTAQPGTVCIEVVLRRDDGRASDAEKGCVQ